MAQFTTKQMLTSRLIGCLMTALVLFFASLITLYKLATVGKTIFQRKKRERAPKILTDPKWGTHRYAKLPNQNIKLHYVEKGDRDKPLLLCIHGFPECWFSYRDTLVEFSKDFWVVAVDMRGYGDSDKPQGGEHYSLELIVDDIRELIEVLGKEKCYLVAHDWGGVIGWTLVHRYPQFFIKHASLNGPHYAAFIEQICTTFSQALRSWYITFFQIPFLPELFVTMDDCAMMAKAFQDDVKYGYKLTDEELEVYRYYFSLENSVTGPINYYRYALKFDKKCSDMRNDSVPTLIVWGENDEALDLGIVSRTFKYCSKLQAVFVPKSGHFVLQEFPDVVHKHIRNFFTE